MSDAHEMEDLPRARGPSRLLRIVVLGAFLVVLAVIWMLPPKEEAPSAVASEASRFVLPPPSERPPMAVRDAQTALETACTDWLDANGMFSSMDDLRTAQGDEAHVCEELLEPGAAESRGFTTGMMAGAFGLMGALIVLSAFRALFLWLWRLPDRACPHVADREL